MNLIPNLCEIIFSDDNLMKVSTVWTNPIFTDSFHQPNNCDRHISNEDVTISSNNNDSVFLNVSRGTNDSIMCSENSSDSVTLSDIHSPSKGNILVKCFSCSIN